jgi:hypothetical protein
LSSWFGTEGNTDTAHENGTGNGTAHENGTAEGAGEPADGGGAVAPGEAGPEQADPGGQRPARPAPQPPPVPDIERTLSLSS